MKNIEQRIHKTAIFDSMKRVCCPRAYPPAPAVLGLMTHLIKAFFIICVVATLIEHTFFEHFNTTHVECSRISRDRSTSCMNYNNVGELQK